jgi:SAM-dependent methyltransferase
MEFATTYLAPEAGGDGQALARTTRQALANLEFALSWNSAGASHTDVYVASNVNLWRDWMPPELEAWLLDKPSGMLPVLDLPPGTLVPAAESRDVLDVPLSRFNRQHLKRHVVTPRAGRFYPKGFIAGVRDVYSEDLTPFRIGRIAGETLTVDLGHPLAGQDLRLVARIADIRQASGERGGRAQDLPQLIAGHGPGMQARWRGEATDFFSDDPFRRGNEGDDGMFYARPRLVDHLDRTALEQVRRLYRGLLPKGGRLLDLMASMNSHLDPDLQPVAVVGLGMNEDELAANAALTARVVHDLNRQPELPFGDDDFDAVVCTVSVEYLAQPFEVFASVARVLRPGGKFVVSFSNRWFPPKAIQLWEDLHPFERMGLVLAYFQRSGAYTNLQTFSLAGLPRPGDDKYAAQMQWSDPIYAVWGEKR